MRLLVLGGTSFVGRSVVEEGVARGWAVTTFNRGRGAWSHPRVERVLGDRLRPADLASLDGRWDAVVDTWAGAPRAVRDSATALASHACRYLYVSSRAVYAPPVPAGLDETHPPVDASPDADARGYAQDKRGAELAAEAAFGDRAVLARAGPIVGPHEDHGRLPYWLRRVARGGRMLTPGPEDLPMRLVDVRDLANWLLDAAQGTVSGAVNLVNPAGHTSTRDLLATAAEVTGGDIDLVWVDPETIAAEGIDRWTAFPGWLPPTGGLAGLVWTDTDRAVATGLRCRPIRETVADTWAWLRQDGPPAEPSFGLAPEREQDIIARLSEKD